MGKTLVIAEKPSVATDLARVLGKLPEIGKFERKGKGRDSYFENEKAVITSAVGHLVELKMPTGPNGKSLPWKFDVLPAIPEAFELQASEKTESRLKQILRLAKRKDTELIINACDAGREGELIFRYIMEMGGTVKPMKRLWMQSMTTNSILEAWKNLREDEEMQNLSDAAKCRSESDWLVGLNSTRALTCFRSRHGGFNITAAGRVQTPTLAILARREREIREFVPQTYWEVQGTFGVSAGTYLGKWVDLGFKKSEKNPHAKANRLWDKGTGQEIVDRCTGKTGRIEEEKKPKKQAPPLLYDLTSLQREAPFSAKQTLQIAQALYERHKMLTYPRTDSRYLPEDYIGNVKSAVQAITKSGSQLAKYAEDVLENDRVKFSKRIFNNAKVSDHFAIIPTGHFVKLTDAEQKVYDMVLKRFLAVFFPSAEFEVTKRLTIIDHPQGEIDTFRTDGRVLITPGWLAVYGRKPGVAADKDELVPVTAGESAETKSIELFEEETKPPARYTEATLLSAMEGAGKLVQDEELREAMAERGLGTPATRAAIIEGLIAQKYLARDGRDLYVSGKGMRLIDLLDEMKIEPLASPSMTGDWEYKLRQMEQGKLDRSSFMKEIIGFTEDIVGRAQKHFEEIKNRPFDDLDSKCPKCSESPIKQTDGTFECRNPECKFKITKYVAGRELSEDEAKTLLAKGFLGPLEGFRSRFNKPFEAALELDEKFKIKFVFEGDDSEKAEDLTEDQLFGKYTIFTGEEQAVYETEKAFHIPGWKPKSSPDGFRMGKTILQKNLTGEDMLPLFLEGKSKLIKGFVSNRTKRAFNAMLTLDPKTGKMGFEFEPRKAKEPKKEAKSET